MAHWRGLPPGGSYGRAQGVVLWALNNWQVFDAWCCTKAIDPLELPSYRFHHMALFALKENRDDEQMEILNADLERLDKNLHPFLDLNVVAPALGVKSKTRVVSVVPKRAAVLKEAPPKDRPIEPVTPATERDEMEARAIKEDDFSYKPSWWRGEAVNAKIAQTSMRTLPKSGE